jgi:hypothetical protein
VSAGVDSYRLRVGAQAGTTLSLDFLAVIGLDGGMRLEVGLTCAAQRKRKASPTHV